MRPFNELPSIIKLKKHLATMPKSRRAAFALATIKMANLLTKERKMLAETRTSPDLKMPRLPDVRTRQEVQSLAELQGMFPQGMPKGTKLSVSYEGKDANLLNLFPNEFDKEVNFNKVNRD